MTENTDTKTVTPDLFDKEAVYDERIQPLMAQIIAICKEHEMPFLASVCFAHEAGMDSFATTFIPISRERCPGAFLKSVGMIAPDRHDGHKN